MLRKLSQLPKRVQISLVSGVFAFLFTAAWLTVGAVPSFAGTCDNTNVIHCGLNESSLSSSISSLRTAYTNNNDGYGHTDIRTAMRWGGYTDSLVAGMNTTNTKAGTLYKDGRIVVDGKTVATQTWISTRYNGGTGFVKIADGLYARLTTTNMDKASEPVVVTFDASGKAIAATMTICGNTLKFVAVVPPKPVIVCKLLTAVPTGTAREYKFTATAAASNTTISKYLFSFGDGQTKIVTSSATSVSTTYTYPTVGKSYSAGVAVAGPDGIYVTAAPCKVTVNVPTPPAPNVTITKTVNDKKSDVVSVNGEFTYKVTVKNTGNVALKNVVVTDTPDAAITLVKADLGTVTSNKWSYTLPALAINESKTFTLTAKVTEYTPNQLVNTACVNAPEVNPSEPTKTDACDTATVTVPPKPAECKPGIPVGDARCTDYCKPGIPVGDARCNEEPKVLAATTTLPDTGAGQVVGIAVAVTLLGAVAHNLLSRRKISE